LPEKLFATNFLSTNVLYLLVHSIFLYHVAIDLKIEDLVFETWFLIQLKKVRWAVQECCQKPVGSVLWQGAYRGYMARGERNKFGSSFQPELFRKQSCVEESTCDIVV